VHDIIYYLLKE